MYAVKYILDKYVLLNGRQWMRLCPSPHCLLVLCNTSHVHSVRRRGRFIAPASTSLLTIIAEWNHLTTQHIFLQFRGYGHDKSVPYAYGMFAAKYILDKPRFAEWMLLNTFRINHVWWNVCCQIHFALNQQTYITAIKKEKTNCRKFAGLLLIKLWKN